VAQHALVGGLELHSYFTFVESHSQCLTQNHSGLYNLFRVSFTAVTVMATSDDLEAWRRTEGIPSLDDEFMQKYFEGRDTLVAQEKKQRSGV
jgi:hypothetical protein